MIDRQPLDELEQDLGRAGVVDLLRRFEADTRRHLDNLRDGIGGNDLRMIQRAAHALTSTSATFGMVATSALARTVDNAGRARDPSAVEAAPRLIEAALRELGLLAEIYPEMREAPGNG